MESILIAANFTGDEQLIFYIEGIFQKPVIRKHIYLTDITFLSQ